MNKTLTGQSAIVTGAGQGIGFEIARKLALHGASVLLNDIDESLAKTAAENIRNEGTTCLGLGGDVSAEADIDRLIEVALNEFGQVTLAVANAGITLFGDFLTYSADDLRKVVNLNLIGTFIFVQKVAVQMKKQKTGGRILLMSSVTGHQAHKGLAAYGMTKAGLEMLAKSLVIELSQHGITINTLAPGATLTERTVNDPDYEKIWSEITPMGRPATPKDIAEASMFFLSPETKHITGQSLVVDGGWTAISPNP